MEAWAHVLPGFQPPMPPAAPCPINASTYNAICVSTEWGLEEVKSRKGLTSGEAHKGQRPQLRGDTNLDGCVISPQEHEDLRGRDR